MLTDFPYKLPPLQHQNEVGDTMHGKGAFALYWEMGLGKTKAIIDEFSCLFLEGKCDAIVIISDKGSYLNWACNELPKHVPRIVDLLPVVWTGSVTHKLHSLIHDVNVANRQYLPVMLCNTEAFSSEASPLPDLIADFLENRTKAYIVLDEATSIKSIKAARTKRLCKLSRHPAFKFRRILTGTPITQSPLDVYAQYHFLGDGLLGFKDYWTFKSRYAVEKTSYAGTRSYQKIVGFQNQGELRAAMAAHCSRLTKLDCLDLPPKIFTTRYVEFSSQQRAYYKELRDELILKISDKTITAALALTKLIKLQQICGGSLLTDEGELVELNSNRLTALENVIEEAGDTKCIIWCHFQHEVEAVVAMLDKMEKGSVVHYYGKTTDEERARALHLFTKDPTVRFFVGTPATGGKSLTLTVATVVIYYSVGFNLEHYLQSQDRAHRIGQDKPVTYVHMACKGKVDEKVLERLQGKKDLAGSILDQLPGLLGEKSEEDL